MFDVSSIVLGQNGYPLAVQLVAIPCQQALISGLPAAPCIPVLPCINYSPAQPQPCVPNSNSTELPAQSPCANHTVTPYPPVPAQPGNAGSDPGSSPSTATPQPSPCANYTVTPYPPVAPYPGTPGSDTDTSYPATTPLPPPCSSHSVTPYPPVAPQPGGGNSNPIEKPHLPPCASEPIISNPEIEPSPGNANDSASANSNQDKGEAPPCVLPPTTATTTPAPPCVTPSTPSTTPPAPDELRACSAGTVFKDGACRQIYCASGAYRNGRCVRVRCPAGTAWTGVKCTPPQPKEFQPIRLKPTIIVETQNLSVNNELSPLVNKFILIQQNQSDYEDNDDDEDEEESEEAPPVVAGNSTKCCNVIAPRTCRCKSGSSRWKCYNRKQQLCGDFCSNSRMVLRPSAVRFWQQKDEQILLMPPNWNAKCQGDCKAVAGK